MVNTQRSSLESKKNPNELPVGKKAFVIKRVLTMKKVRSIFVSGDN